ncbi:glycosyltransferase family 4 protein [Paenibacillus sp. 2TAB26]|uniref:glycosyltransferase family 4 protein n=1 Tax=Paenibacillus sp. 2TAB26 TaxID=3233005 RepID=UPI003F9589E3
MKVLHINSNYLYTTLHEKLIESLSESSITNNVYMPNHGGIKFVIPPKDYVYHPVCFNKSDRYFYNYKQKKIFNNINKIFDTSSYDLIHSHTLFTDGYIAYNLYKKYGVPYIVAVRNTDVNSFFKKRILLRKKGLEILNNAAKIIFISKAYQDIVFDNYVPIVYKKNLLEKSIIIPNGIDSFWLKKQSAPREQNSTTALNLIFAGRIDKNKNIRTTIKACELLINKGLDISFTVVGRIEDSNEFNYFSRYNFVRYLPQQPKEKLIDLYKSNDIFVMPSKTETFGLVYAEAMSQGLPVIYTKGEGFDGQFEDGFIGYRVDWFNAMEIADRILDIMKNYNELSENCIKSCVKYDWDLIVEKYKNIYEYSGKSEV